MSSFLNTFLNSPIISNNRDKFFANLCATRIGESPPYPFPQHEQRTANQYLQRIKDRDIDVMNPGDYYFMESLLPTNVDTDIIDNAAAIAERITGMFDGGLTQWGLPHGAEHSLHRIGVASRNAIPEWSRMITLKKMVDSISTRWSRSDTRVRPGSTPLFSWYSDCSTILIIPTEHETSWLISYDQLLMFKDMYYSRFNALVAAYQIYGTRELPDIFRKIFDWFTKCLVRYQNAGYGIGKQVEALTISWISGMSDELLGKDFMITRMTSVIREKEKDLGGISPYLADELTSILRKIDRLDYCVEVFGTQKMFGHPLVDPTVGGDKVKEEARKVVNTSPVDVARLRSRFCYMYTEGYIRKNGEWPPLIFSDEGRQTQLYHLFYTNETKISLLSYDQLEWRHVRFAKHFDFDYYINFLDLVDDKAISLYRSNMAATWDKRIPPKSHKRLLLEMLNQPEISVFKIVQQVCRGQIPFDWFIVSLYPKEREFKTAARMFGMLVLEMRMFFTATEANLSEFVFPYLPCQTMTLSKDEIEGLFHRVTDVALDDTYARLFLVIDFSSWNLHWDAITVDPIGTTIEQMCGIPGLYTVVHHFFVQCVMLVRTQECCPDGLKEASQDDPTLPIPESSLLWCNHKAGIEGLCQKIWTCCTYPMVDLAVSHYGYKYYLIGQGDNQILLFYIPRSTSPNESANIQDLADEILTAVVTTSGYYGQDAKLDECVVSTNTVSYSKNVYVDGVPYYTSCKAFSRVFPNASDDYPTVTNMASGLSSQCLAASEYLKYPLHGYTLWLFHFSLYLLSWKVSIPTEAQSIGKVTLGKMTLSMIYALCILPRSLGGLPALPCVAFLYKGGADPLSKDYSSLKILQSHSTVTRRLIYGIKTRDWFDEHPKPEALIDDPYSLPIISHTTVEMAMYNESLQRVKAVTKNLAIRAILSDSVDDYESRLRTALVNIRPFNPLIASDIFGWSVAGVKRMIGKMFTATRTIQELTRRRDGPDAVGTILDVGASEVVLVLGRLSKLRRCEATVVSIYADITEMRQAWEAEWDNTVVGVTAYTPFEGCISCTSYPDTYPGVKGLSVGPNGPGVVHRRGKFDPYLGLRTKEKRSEHGYKIVTSTAPTRAIKRLADVLVQPGLDVTTKYLISEVAKSRANIDLLKTEPYLGKVYGGTVAHRYNTRLGVRQAHGLGSLAAASQCCLSTNQAIPLIGGEDDYPRMVQEDMVCVVACCQLETQVTDLPVFVTIRYDNVPMLRVSDMTMYSPLDLIPKPSRIQRSSLAYQDSVDLEVLAATVETSLISKMAKETNIQSLAPHALCRLVSRGLARSHSALVVSDAGSGDLRIKFGLPEILGMGLRTTLHYTSLAIARGACSLMFKSGGSSPRWRFFPGSLSVCTAVARKISSLVRSPLFQDDPLLLSLQGVAPVSYMSGVHSLQRKMTSYLMKSVVSMITTDQSPLYLYPTFLFSDEPSGILVREIIGSLRVHLIRQYYFHGLPWSHAMKISNQILPQMIRREVNQSGKLSALYRFHHFLANWSENSNYFGMSSYLKQVIHGVRFFQYMMPAVEVIRSARGVTNIARLILETPVRTDIPQLNNVYQPGSWRTCANGRALARPEWSQKIDNSSLDCFAASRLRGRFKGGDSSVGYSYTYLIPYACTRVCVVVGCGLGGGPAVLLAAGCPWIIGLDLGADLSEAYDLDVPIYPPCIAPLEGRSRFTRLPPGPLAQGDIRHQETIEAIKKNCSTGGVLIVDIPLHSRDDVLTLLQSVARLWQVTDTWIRWIGSVLCFQELCAALSFSYNIQGSGVIHCTGGFCEAWVHVLLTLPVIVAPCAEIHATTIDDVATQLMHDLVPGGGIEYLESLIFGPYASLNADGAEMELEDIWKMVDQSIGPFDHRFSYEQWSYALSAYLCHLITNSPTPMDSVESLMYEDVIEVRIGTHLIPISLTKDRKRLLSRVLPRIIV